MRHAHLLRWIAASDHLERAIKLFATLLGSLIGGFGSLPDHWGLLWLRLGHREVGGRWWEHALRLQRELDLGVDLHLFRENPCRELPLLKGHQARRDLSLEPLRWHRVRTDLAYGRRRDVSLMAGLIVIWSRGLLIFEELGVSHRDLERLRILV